MDEEIKCKICGKLKSEDCHFYTKEQLCNRHYLQIHRHGHVIPEDEIKLKIKKSERICSYCGTDQAKIYYRWKHDGQYKNKIFCSRHYIQLLKHGEFLEDIEKKTECQICGSKHKLIQSRKFHGTFCQRHFTQLYNLGEIKTETIFDRNQYIIKGEAVEIILKNGDFEEVGRTLIDTEDLDRVKNYKWRLNTWGYAETGHKQSVLLQRLILNTYDKNLIVDHINRNRLDNRKENLRIVNKSENAVNADLRTNNSSGVTGVSWNKNLGLWRAYINYNSKRYELGYSKDYEEAIKKRLLAEKKYYGDFAPQKELFKKYNI